MSETPIEDFIREATVWVEKDGQTYFEMVMSTVHELERRFTAERRRVEAAEDTLDLFVDEFKRIKSCDSANDEIKGICQRAIENLVQRVPIIVQRDNAEKKVAELESRLQEAEKEIADRRDTEQSLTKMAIDDGEKIKELEARLAERERKNMVYIYPDSDHEATILNNQHKIIIDLQASLAKHKAVVEAVKEANMQMGLVCGMAKYVLKRQTNFTHAELEEIIERLQKGGKLTSESITSLEGDKLQGGRE